MCGCGREMCALPSISLKINAANSPLQWASLLDNQFSAKKLNNGWLRSRLWLWMRVCVLSNASSGAQLSNVRLAHAPAGRSSKWTFQQEHWLTDQEEWALGNFVWFSWRGIHFFPYFRYFFFKHQGDLVVQTRNFQDRSTNRHAYELWPSRKLCLH